MGPSAKPKRTALLRDFQVDPVEGNVLHADLFEISMDKPIRVKVPVHVIGGTPAGRQGRRHPSSTIRVNCMSSVCRARCRTTSKSMHRHLTIGQGIHLKEIAKIEGVRYLDDPDQMVVSVAVPMSDAKLEALLTSQAAGPEGGQRAGSCCKGQGSGRRGGRVAAAPGAAAAAPAPGAEAKAGEKKEGAAAAAAPKAEKKEAEKKK